MKSKNYFKHLLLLVLFGFCGILAAGCGNKSSSSSKSSTSSITYQSFDTYYLTTTHDIAMGNVSVGTPVWFWGRGNVMSDGKVIEVYDNNSSYRLHYSKNFSVSHGRQGIELQPSGKYIKIYGYIDGSSHLTVLAAEHSGKIWY